MLGYVYGNVTSMYVKIAAQRRCIERLHRQVEDLELELATLRRQNELLREMVEVSRTSPGHRLSSVKYKCPLTGHWTTQATPP